MWKLQRSVSGAGAVLRVSGRIEGKESLELQEILAAEPPGQRIILDLKEVKLVDREAIQCLARYKADGVILRNCRPYIRNWLSQIDNGRIGSGKRKA
jgi:anti-anti-sigma regulatory factor